PRKQRFTDCNAHEVEMSRLECGVNRGRLMKTPMLLALAGLSIPTAQADEPTYLSCSGTLYVLSAGRPSPEEPWTLSLIIDTDKKTVTVADYPPVKLFSDEKNTVVFNPSPPSDFGVSTGTLNRITGEARIRIIREGLQIFRGTCKSARKLF